MRTLALTLLTTVAWAAGSKRPTALEIELDIVTRLTNTTNRQSTTETQNHRIWIRGNRVRREERSIAGTEVLIEADGMQFLFSPEAKKGLKRKVDKPSARTDYPEYFDPQGFREWIEKTGAKKSGSERVNGVDCEVYTQSEGPATLKRWLRKDNGMPMKNAVEARPADAPHTVTTMKITRVKVGGTISDSLFQAPKGYEYKEVKDEEPPKDEAKGKGKKN